MRLPWRKAGPPADGWRVGDVVRLNSGGPEMVVVEIRKDGNVVGIWFPEGCGPMEYAFPPECLTYA